MTAADGNAAVNVGEEAKSDEEAKIQMLQGETDVSLSARALFLPRLL